MSYSITKSLIFQVKEDRGFEEGREDGRVRYIREVRVDKGVVSIHVRQLELYYC